MADLEAVLADVSYLVCFFLFYDKNNQHFFRWRW